MECDDIVNTACPITFTAQSHRLSHHHNMDPESRNEADLPGQPYDGPMG